MNTSATITVTLEGKANREDFLLTKVGAGIVVAGLVIPEVENHASGEELPIICGSVKETNGVLEVDSTGGKTTGDSDTIVTSGLLVASHVIAGSTGQAIATDIAVIGATQVRTITRSEETSGPEADIVAEADLGNRIEEGHARLTGSGGSTETGLGVWAHIYYMKTGPGDYPGTVFCFWSLMVESRIQST